MKKLVVWQAPLEGKQKLQGETGYWGQFIPSRASPNTSASVAQAGEDIGTPGFSL